MAKLTGKNAEKAAELYLKRKGLQLIQRNYFCRLGEIDLIMLDKDEMVFVEVRYRHSDLFGGALESINQAKQKKICKTAEYYLFREELTEALDFRFDVVVFERTLDNPTWIPNAFFST